MLSLGLSVGLLFRCTRKHPLSIEPYAIVIRRPGDQAINRRERDYRIFELLLEKGGMFDRHVARDTPADPQRGARHLSVIESVAQSVGVDATQLQRNFASYLYRILLG